MAEQDIATKAEIPESVADALRSWAEQYAYDAGAGTRDALAQSKAEHADTLAALAERDEAIERLTVELRNIRQVASDALVGKAKDQLAIEGKDAQIADLRNQLERSLAATATESDARLAAQMELVGATTARDNFEAEIKELRAQLDAAHAERRSLKTEKEVLLARL